MAAEGKSTGRIDDEFLAQCEGALSKDSAAQLAQAVLHRNEFPATMIRREPQLALNQLFSVAIPAEAKITHQKSSGRCWLFAALNVMRLPLIAEHKLDNFEFSQNYLFFFDKLEKANYFLETMIELVHVNEDSRLVQYLLKHPVNDGGQYDMFINLVERYGLVPKDAMPETAHSGASHLLNWMLTNRLRECTVAMRRAFKGGATVADLRALKEKQLAEVYRVLSIFLGQPPSKFDWRFRNKEKKLVEFTGLSPLAFARDVAKFPVSKYVSLVNDPRNPYYRLYTVEYLGNVVGGRKVLYVNLPIDELKRLTRVSLEAGEAVWFGCDVGKFLDRENGVLDPDWFAYELVVGAKFGMSKAERLRFGESLMTHAMVFTAVDIRDGKPTKWRVENSWGEKSGKDGYLNMTDAWFDEFVYQIVQHVDRLPAEAVAVLQQQPTVLPAWDPMGSLA